MERPRTFWSLAVHLSPGRYDLSCPCNFITATEMPHLGFMPRGERKAEGNGTGISLPLVYPNLSQLLELVLGQSSCRRGGWTENNLILLQMLANA